MAFVLSFRAIDFVSHIAPVVENVVYVDGVESGFVFSLFLSIFLDK